MENVKTIGALRFIVFSILAVIGFLLLFCESENVVLLAATKIAAFALLYTAVKVHGNFNEEGK